MSTTTQTAETVPNTRLRAGTRTRPQLRALGDAEVTITVADGTVAIYPADGPRLLFATEAFLLAFLGAGGMEVSAVTR
ncbi:MAG: hypothetical protein KJ792_15635 [Actinobacteria bacterium]|nr:hypothetical protein [Actinomycetota bacterium]